MQSDKEHEELLAQIDQLAEENKLLWRALELARMEHDWREDTGVCDLECLACNHEDELYKILTKLDGGSMDGYYMRPMNSQNDHMVQYRFDGTAYAMCGFAGPIENYFFHQQPVLVCKDCERVKSKWLSN